MSTLTMDKQSRFKLGSKHGNTLRRKKNKSGRSLTGAGQIVVRTIMVLLTLSFVAVLGVGLLYGYRLVTSHPYFELKEIHVTGNDRLTYGNILKTGDVNLGLNCLEMNLSEVKEKLSANPWIQSVNVRREFPNKLRIGVTEKTPVFWIRQGDGLYFADAKGKVIAPMHPGEMTSLPILSIADNVEDGQAVLTGFLKRVGKRQAPFTQAETAWIKLTSAREIEFYLDGQDLTVRLSMDHWEIQLERLEIVWRDLMRRNEFKDAAIIAASGEKIWVKKRPAKGLGA
ncbi:MAG: FtsQ-type POTRA domain-containing protein [Pseudodesulfovibrio sp.]|nr:FtsQ-type POTRA domain-containing protein [Pseudodesulfovibrio sp.]